MLKPRGGRAIAGARLARSVSAAIIAIYGVRVGGTRLGHDFSFANCWAGYAVLVRILMFLSISLNFGFLLMAMDSEVADLPLQDDLTGVGNRRHPVQRPRERCARSQWSGEPFTLRVINLDGSKE